MSFDYSKSAATALKLLTKFGQDITHRVYTLGTYDPSTGTNSVTYSDVSRKGAMFDFGAGQTMNNGTLIQSGDKKLLVDGGAIVSLQDHFIVNGVEYTVVSVGEINPAGTSVMFEVHLRI